VLPLAVRARGAETPVAGASARPQTAAEIIPPPVPDAENAAPLYLEALAVVEAEDVWGSNLAELAAAVYGALYAPSAHRNLLVQLEAFHVPEAGNHAPTVAEASEELGRRLETPAVARAIGLVEKAVALPGCRFNVDYTKGAETQLPHLAKMRGLTRFLGAVTAVVAGQGDATTAWDCVAWSLGVADAVRSEPLLISQLVRMAQAGLALSTLQEVTERASPDAATGARIDTLLARFDDLEPLTRALDGERLLFGEWLFSQPADKVRELVQPSDKVRDLAKAEGPAADPDLTPEQLAAALEAYRQTMVRLSDLSRLPYHVAKPRIEAEVAAAAAVPIARSLLPALTPCTRKAAEFQAQVRVTRLGLRLKLHKAAHGAYPPSLAELDLAGLTPEAQQDPFTGKPLTYRAADAGFLLYSVGPDEADDDGLPKAGASKARYDIVWRTAK